MYHGLIHGIDGTSGVRPATPEGEDSIGSLHDQRIPGVGGLDEGSYRGVRAMLDQPAILLGEPERARGVGGRRIDTFGPSGDDDQALAVLLV